TRSTRDWSSDVCSSDLGVRISTIVHIGGDAVIGIRLPDAALMFEADPLTEAIVIFGEIGSSQEEELAQLIVDGKITKPVIAYIRSEERRVGKELRQR